MCNLIRINSTDHGQRRIESDIDHKTYLVMSNDKLSSFGSILI